MRHIFWLRIFALPLIVGLFYGSGLLAQEHPGEHPGEHPAKEVKVKPDQVEKAILDYIRQDSGLKGGFFLIWDQKENKAWKLDFSKLHDQVRVIEGKTYFVCADFNFKERPAEDSVKTTTLDIDFWLEEEDGELKVSQIKIHKVKGVPRFEYEKDKIKPLEE